MRTNTTQETTLKSAEVSTYWNVLLPAIAFSLPILLSHPQWLTGVLVNCFLLLASSFLSRRALLGVIVLPPLGAITRGALFGPFTLFLLWFIPFIWIGNWILTALFDLLRPRLGDLLALVASAVAKSALLFTVALVYVRFDVVPSVFLTAMGVFQLATAMAGGLLALAILRFVRP